MVKSLIRLLATLRVGSELFTKIKVLKIRNERPTVIEVFGQRYVWDSTVNNRRTSGEINSEKENSK